MPIAIDPNQMSFILTQLLPASEIRQLTNQQILDMAETFNQTFGSTYQRAFLLVCLNSLRSMSEAPTLPSVLSNVLQHGWLRITNIWEFIKTSHYIQHLSRHV